ncbi:hypothetical protein C8J56DRAFT_719844, partial [Mycena floridula]
VITIYTRSGGKAAKHSWVPLIDTIGASSYISVQVFQHTRRQVFKTNHSDYATLGLLRFAHLPAAAFLI